MASYTDKTPTFNPYVEQLPIEAMVQVGMEKQKQYNEGIQKIQTNIDNVAGLDIMKTEHQNYLESKLNKLGNDLKYVAAADFSNFQLVNSVSGMTNQIVKDPIVQGAVYSTKVVRKGQNAMETAKKAGKSSVQNEARFNYDVSNWLNDGDMNTKFNGEYVDYIDIDKKLREVAEKIHEVDNSFEIPFKRDNAGNTLYYKTDAKGQTSVSTDPNSGGVTKIDDAILSIKTKGKPAEKILANFYDSINENDKRQLGIDSWYHYRGATKETFKKDISDNYRNTKTMLNDEIINLSLKLQTDTKLTNVDRSAIQARINDVSEILNNGSLDKKMNDQLLGIDNIKDLDKFKQNLYTEKTLTNLAKDMSWQSYQMEYKTNPYAQMDMERKRLQFQYDDAARDQRNKDRDFGWKQYTWGIEQSQKAAEKLGPQPIVTPGRISTDVDKPSVDKLNGEITAIVGDPKVPGSGQIQQLNSDYGKSLTNIKDKKKYLDGLYSAYAKDPSFLSTLSDPNMREYLEKRRSLEITVAQKRALANETMTQSKKFDDELDIILRTEGGITDRNGKRIYTAKDLFTFSNVAESYYVTTSSGASPTTGAPTSKTTLDAEGLMREFKGTTKEALARAYVKHYYKQRLSPTEEVLFKRAQEVKYKFGPKGREIFQKKREFEANFLAQRMPERQTNIGTLSSANTDDMDRVTQLITRKGIEFSQGGVDSDKKGQFDPDQIQTLREGKGVGYTIEKKYDGSANLIISSGKSQQIIPMTPDEFSAYFPRYSRPNAVNDIKYAVLSSPNKTTNISGVKDASAAVNAYLSGESLPQLRGTSLSPLVRLDVDGSPFNDGSGNDRYVVRMYVNNNGEWLTQTLTPDYVNDATMQGIINGIGTTTVESILKQNRNRKR
jgi:hypothetical protein